MKIMVSELEKGTCFNNFILFVGVYVLVLFFSRIFSNFIEYINSLSINKFVYGIQSKLIDKISKIEYKTFYSPNYQDEYSTVVQNSQHEASNLIYTTIQMSALLVQLIITSSIIMRFNLIILISLLVVIFLFLIYLQVQY